MPTFFLYTFASRRNGFQSRGSSQKSAFRPRVELLEARNLLNAGDLDLLFGTGGKVLTDFVGPIAATAKATVIEPDGKIIVAGSGGETGTFRTILALKTGGKSLRRAHLGRRLQRPSSPAWNPIGSRRRPCTLTGFIVRLI